MRMVDTARFRNADKYASYLKTMAGRLRLDLAWENLRPRLPGNASKRHALDLGGGTGSASVKVAEVLSYRSRLWCLGHYGKRAASARQVQTHGCIEHGI
jgi:ubiquinone/menaquinone biosynthesis C-methylase UbiE